MDLFINEKLIGGAKSKKQTHHYNIENLNTDFNLITSNNKTKINICCYRIVVSNKYKEFAFPFLQYMLYKYPYSNKEHNDLCIFPFEKKDNKNIIKQGKSMVKKIFSLELVCKGYTQNRNNIYLFFNIPYKNMAIGKLNRNNELWWATISEICNNKKMINFPIHKSVYNIFYNNPFLIYLKNGKKQNIEIPQICYYGDSYEIMPAAASLGIKNRNGHWTGDFYITNDLIGACRWGMWSTNLREKKMFGKTITDKEGKFKKGGLLRLVVFLKKNLVTLYQKKDLNYNFIKTEYIEELSGKWNNKNRGKWGDSYDSLIISKIKNKKHSGYFNNTVLYSVTNSKNLCPLSYHELDPDTFKLYWDPNYEFYNIK